MVIHSQCRKPESAFTSKVLFILQHKDPLYWRLSLSHQMQPGHSNSYKQGKGEKETGTRWWISACFIQASSVCGFIHLAHEMLKKPG